jgi:hypothetical protein
MHTALNATSQIRFKTAVPYVLLVLLALLAAWRWHGALDHVYDTWHGQQIDRREDVVAYYAAGQLVADGFADRIYQPETIAAVEETILGRPAGRAGGLVYLNPPYMAGMFQYLTELPYNQAQAAWFALNAFAFAASLALLWPDVRRLPRIWRAVAVVAALAAFPVSWSLVYGQCSSLVLLAWALFYRLTKSRHDLPAGLSLAGALIKPNLALVPLVSLVATRRWGALATLLVAAMALIGSSIALVGAHVTFVEYPVFLIGSLHWHDEYGIDRDHMYGWLGFFGSVLRLERIVATPLAGVASLVTVAAALLVSQRDQESARPLLALAIASILISPHLHAQDLQLLLVPMLVASRRDLSVLGLPVLLVLLMPSNIVAVTIAPPVLAAVLAYVVLSREESLPPTLSERLA